LFVSEGNIFDLFQLLLNTNVPIFSEPVLHVSGYVDAYYVLALRHTFAFNRHNIYIANLS